MSAGFLESAGSLLAGILELGRTRFELFGTELREELAWLAATVIGGLVVVVLVALGLAFGAAALILTVSETNRVAAALGVAALFLLVAGIVALRVRRMAEAKPRAFDATISELQRDLSSLRS